MSIKVTAGAVLSYETTWDEPGLNAGVKIFDTTAGTYVPVVGLAGMVNGVLPMANVTGVSYGYFFTATLGKTYFFHRAIYTDGTYTVVDPDKPQGSLTIEAGRSLEDVIAAVAAVQARVDALEAEADALDRYDDLSTALAALQVDVNGVATQNSVNALTALVEDIPTNPLLTTDARLDRLDVAVSTRCSQASFDQILGAGWAALADSLVAIRNAIDDSSNAEIAAALQQAMGAGFNSADHSLVQIRIAVEDAETAAELAQQAAVDAKNAALAGATGSQADEILALVAEIPVNPVLATDARLNRLDATISSRATASALQQVFGAGFDSDFDGLHQIKQAIDAINAGDATEANQEAILAALNSVATQARLNDAIMAIGQIPTNPVLASDSRLSRLDATVSSRCSQATFNLILGSGFDSTATLAAIRSLLGTGVAVDLSPVLAVLQDIKGAGFSTGADALKPVHDESQSELTSLKADTAALLSTGQALRNVSPTGDSTGQGI